MRQAVIRTVNLEAFGVEIRKALDDLKTSNIVSRIWKKDYTVWKDRDEEISNRLGWLESPERAVEAFPQYEEFAREVVREGFQNAVLLGMGGSSLAPEVFSRVFGAVSRGLKFHVLDSTDPEAVLDIENACSLEKTLFVVSSKSGTTLETRSFLNYFHYRAWEILGRNRAGRHFIAITDPGTALEKIGRELRFLKIFAGDANIGGRFSAISPFGLVPAALIGLDIGKLVDYSRQAARLCRNTIPSENPGVYLGALLGTLALAGKDKLIFLLSPEIENLGAWIEQLVAESSGKEGKGILPIVRSAPFSADCLGADRVFFDIKLAGDRTHEVSQRLIAQSEQPLIEMELADRCEIGSQFFFWEMATAAVGYFLKINPFDQPNVAAAKKKTEAVLRIFEETGSLPQETPCCENEHLAFYGEFQAGKWGDVLGHFLDQARGGDYICLQAFLPPRAEIAAALQNIAAKLQGRTKLPVTFDLGPRFLHSTGQLHKGDKGNGLFIQLTADHGRDVSVPDSPTASSSSLTFGIIEHAQARGDFEALKEKSRRILRIRLRENILSGLRFLGSRL
jgi:glucose-6-phosphate isomerase